MLISEASKTIGDIAELDGTSTTLLPSRLKVFTVASSPGIPTTTMSPLPGGDGLLMLGDGSTLRLSRTYRSRVR